MSTIINALKQLDSKGVAFAPQSSPDSIDDGHEPVQAKNLPDPVQAVADGGVAQSPAAEPLSPTVMVDDGPEPVPAEVLPDPDQAVADRGDAEPSIADPLPRTVVITDPDDLCTAVGADDGGDETGGDVQVTETSDTIVQAIKESALDDSPGLASTEGEFQSGHDLPTHGGQSVVELRDARCEPEPEPQSEPESEPEFQSEPEPEPESTLEFEARIQSQFEADPGPDVALELASEPELQSEPDAELPETEQTSDEPDCDDMLTVMFENASREPPPTPTVRIADLIDSAAPVEELPAEDLLPEDVGATKPLTADAEPDSATRDAGEDHDDAPNRECQCHGGLYDIDGTAGLDLTGHVAPASTSQADAGERSESAIGALSSDSNSPEPNESEPSEGPTCTDVDDSFTAQLVDLPHLTPPLQPGEKLQPSPQTERFEQVHPTEPYQPIESVDEGVSVELADPVETVLVSDNPVDEGVSVEPAEPVETVLVGDDQQASQAQPATESGMAEQEDEAEAEAQGAEGSSESTDAGQGTVSDEGRDYEQSLLENLTDVTLAQQYSRALHRMIAASPSGLPTVVMVLSSRHQSHVSETLAHMAMLLVQRDAGRVLLVDAGLPRKTLSRQFGVAKRPGLADLCRGDKGWNEVLVSGTDSRLCILPAGTGPTPPILGADKVADMVKQWKEEAQIVLVDVGSLQSPLTEALTQAGDSVFLLVRLGQTQRKEAEAAVAKLRGLGSSLQGCIVTNAGAPSTA